jgi:hypothetical protein
VAIYRPHRAGSSLMNVRNQPIKLAQVDDLAFIRAVTEAASSISFDEFSAKSVGNAIDDLSTNTVFEGLEISPDTIFSSKGDSFEASGIVYVELNYGGSRDPVSMPDSYPAVVRGKYSNGKADIEEIDVDTSSFYE